MDLEWQAGRAGVSSTCLYGRPKMEATGLEA